ncbi:MAG: electron transfer flavoprotein subunit alpha/FixB family protein [Chlorobiaceae bacterium]|nr:electron transfer flavoprotein subunit alpha/FixB family protein [Chlorobiaceae bacterium]
MKKALLVAECRQGRLVADYAELPGFARALGSESSMVLVGYPEELPRFDGRLHFADAREYGEYNPDVHKRLVLRAVEAERPDYVVFMHSSYGWDLAPRVAAAMRAAQVSEVSGIGDGGFVTGCCNGKMRRTVRPLTPCAVLTLRQGAFHAERGGEPRCLPLEAEKAASVQLLRYEPPAGGGIDLSRAEVVVSAGRGVGRQEHIELVRALAEALGGEVGASRPVVDAGWLEHGRQIGSTGQTVAPSLYVACGVSGAIQHVAGMKGSGFVIAINTDRDAPIAEVADLLVAADLEQFLPVLISKLRS